MTLAQLIYKAVYDPQFRDALEAGQIQADEWGLSPMEVTTAAQVMRSTRGLPTDGLWTMLAAYLRVDEHAQPLPDEADPSGAVGEDTTRHNKDSVPDLAAGAMNPRKGLAHLIHKATQDADFRQALIAGEVQAADWNVSTTELAAAIQVMRHSTHKGEGLGSLFAGFPTNPLHDPGVSE